MFAQLARGLALAVVLTFGLEFVHALHRPWPEAVARLLDIEPGVLAIGVLLVWALIVFFHAVTNRLWVSATIVTLLAVIIGAADLLKQGFRGQPLFLADAAYLGELSFLIENVGAGAALALAAIVVAIPVSFWLIARWLARRRVVSRRPAPAVDDATVPALVRIERDDDGEAAPQRRFAVARVISGTAALTVIALAATFNWNGSPARALYEAAGARWAPWNQSQNYDDNGLIAGLLYTLPSSAMDEPEGYSEAAMADLVDRYTERAAELNEGRDPAVLQGANIVVVLSESLSDPAAIPGIEAEDPLPFLRGLMAENPSGTMISAGYGGGTASVEWEVLTGMAVANLKPQVDSPFQSMVAPADSFPSFLMSLSDARVTSAIHPYSPNFYRRSEVYPALGFNQWAFWDTLNLAKIPGDRHVSDAGLYGEILRQIRETDEPMFINAVSMQNHGPQEGLANPFEVSGPLSDGQAATAGQYLRGLADSDEALEELVGELGSLGEPTIVLVYGDHLPTVWPQSLLEEAGPVARYSTPWVVFANFPLQPVDGGTVGANQLMNQVVDAAGGHHTPWTALLDAVAEELPAMERTAWLDADGNVLDLANLPESAAQVLADYELAQYDMTEGEGYATAALYGAGE